MKSPIHLNLLMAGALALAAATPMAFAAAGDEAATTGNQPSVDYKAQLDQCKNRAPTDQAPCKDAVGMRASTPSANERVGTAAEDMGSLQSRDKCARLSGDAQRQCLLNDKAD